METLYGFDDIAGELEATEFYLRYDHNLFREHYPRIFVDMKASHPVDLQDAEFLRLLILHSILDSWTENGSKEFVENFASVASHRLLESDILIESGFRV